MNSNSSQTFLLRTAKATLVVMLLLLVVPAAVSACPTCKDGIAQDGGGHMARGYQASIIFMMSMPFLILGGLSTYFYLEVRRARRRQLSEQSLNPALSDAAALTDAATTH